MIRQWTAVTAGTVLLAGMLAAPAAAQPSQVDPGGTGTTPGTLVEPEGEGTGLWIVRLAEPALASYTGGVPGLAPTSPRTTGTDRVDPAAPASQAYLEHLQQRQHEVLAEANQELGRAVEVEFAYRNAVNGLAVRVDRDEAAALTDLPGVASVHRDVARELQTDVSHDLIASASVWGGATGSGQATRGEDVLVGVIDTGVNPGHPSFATTDGDGYTHTNPYGSGNYQGVCDPDHPEHEDICNDKLVGAWNLHPFSPNAQDADGHGSHTASTIAGGVHEAVFPEGGGEFTRTVQGVAPRANVISYLVCFPSCPVTSSVAAVDQAIADGVDVLNYSIGGSDNPWNDIVDLAFLDAYEAGIFVAAAAGNDGPCAGTVAHTGPWNAAVAATTHQRVFANRMEVTGAPALPDSWVVPGTGPQLAEDLAAPVRDAGQASSGNSRGCEAFPAGSFTDSVALVARGECAFAAKVNNAAAAGAVAVVVYNDVAGPPVSMGALEETGIPAVMTDLDSGTALRDALTEHGDSLPVHIDADTQLVEDASWQDVVAGFSSRGPSQFDLLAPTFAAPGVNILAASAASGGDADQYAVQQGTSMASPHGAGAGALLTALHPDWSPGQVRSALAGTAVSDGLRTHDGVTAADPFDVGAGRLDLDRAGRVGLVLDETHADFLAADPSQGGDPRQLNVAGMVDRTCAGECTWHREVTSVVDTSASYAAAVDAPEGVTVTVAPEQFTLDAGGTQSVEIAVEVDVSVVPAGEWAFGTVSFTTDATHPDGPAVAPASYPLALVPMPAPPQRPELTVAPESISATQLPGQTREHTVTIGNEGNTDLQWQVSEDETLRHPRGATEPVPATTPATTPSAADGHELGADASTAGQEPRSAVPPRPEPATDLTRTITHSASQAVVSGNSVACSPDEGVTTTDNAYLRAFRLSDFDLVDRFEVTEVEFGVENLTTSAELTVNLYTMVDPDGALVSDNLAPIGSASQPLTPQSLDLARVPVAGHAGAEATLVVEVQAPDLAGVGGFWPGSNGAGQSGPGYLRSESCDMPEPVNLAALGFAGMHLVMNVTGTTEAPTCDVPGASWAAVSPASGTVSPGEDQELLLATDSADLSPGAYEANLCLASNDPRRPLVAVPVTMTVQAPPEIDLGAQVWLWRGAYEAQLDWSGVTTDEVDIYRDGERVATVPAAGSYTDELGRPRAHVTEFDYQVCHAGEEFCSPVQTVVVDRRGTPPRPPWHPGPRPTMEVTTDQLPDLHVLELYRHTLTASGGSGAYEWHATGLPEGLVLDADTGTIANDPAEPAITDGGTATVTVTAVDAGDPALSATATLELSVVGVSQLAAGWGHTCAVTTEQAAYCWGRNATGQIGNGVVGGDGVHEPLPTQVLDSDGDAPLTGVQQIAGGDGHTCALTGEATVYCWGASFDGRLGYGDPTLEPQPLPMQVRNPDDTGPLTGVVDITTGSQFGCAVTEASSAYCWGNNHSGKLGTGEVGGTEPLPVAVTGTDGSGALGGVDAITGGGSHACAQRGDEAYCWGNNFQGQLGSGETSTPVPHPVPVMGSDGTGTLTGVTALAAAAGHTCAATESGGAYCWGRNSSGQIGDGIVGGNRPVPTRVRDGDDAGPLTGVSIIATGDNHTCVADADGYAYCWGSNFYGQLGNPEASEQNPLPVPVHDHAGAEPLADVGGLVAGNAHSCARGDDGTVSCWGANFNRQLGIGETDDQHRQVLPAPVHPAGWPGPPLGITTESLPTLHLLEEYQATLAAEHGQQPYQWSASGLPEGLVLDPDTGVVANDPSAPAVTEPPGPVTFTVTDSTGERAHAVLEFDTVAVAQMAAGREHACAITTAATVYCWGANTSGQLGDGTFDDRRLPRPVVDPDNPQAVLTGAVDLTAGDAHTCAATADGAAYCWGFNGAGRLGLGHDDSVGVPVPSRVVHLSDVTSVAAGSLHTCALAAGGAAYCWGDNFRGQAGSPGQVGGTPTPVVDPDGGTGGLTGLAAIGGGGFHSCAVTEASTGYCWGWNHVGQLGTGETFPIMSDTPLPVVDPDNPELRLTGLAHISGGGVHTCAGTTTGVGYCWGQNAHGQVGNGASPANVAAPAAVVDPDDPDSALTGLVSVGPGTIHSCGVTEDATAYCWGNNSEGQLGDGGTEDSDVPRTVVDPADPERAFGDVAQLVHRGWFTCAVTTVGGAFCWGHNARGQLGDGTVDNRHLPTPVHPGP